MTVRIHGMIEDATSKGQEVTPWGLTRALADAHRLTDEQRSNLYERVKTSVRVLEDAGMISARREHDHERNVTRKLLTHIPRPDVRP